MEFRGSRGTIRLGYDKAWFYWEAPNSKEMGMVDGVTGATRKMMNERDGFEITMDNHKEGWEGTHYALRGFHRCIVDQDTPISDISTGADLIKPIFNSIPILLQLFICRNAEHWK